MSKLKILEQLKEKILQKINNDIYSMLPKVAGPNAQGWVTCRCPFHADKEPSFGYNVSHFGWVCFGGCGRGDVFTFLMVYYGLTFSETIEKLSSLYNVYLDKPPIDVEYIQKLQKNLTTEQRELLKTHRLLSDETIDKYQIGFDGMRRYSIPIKDDSGTVVNIRWYNPHAIKMKMVNHKPVLPGRGKIADSNAGYGSPFRLYGADEITEDIKTLVLCEGEFDRLLLEQYGFKAVTSTAGCASFNPKWVSYFAERETIIIYDADEAGKKEARRIASTILKDCKVKVVILPLSGTKDDKDITDWFRAGHTAQELQELINETPHQNEIQQNETEPEKPILLKSFLDIDKKEYFDKYVQCDVVICGETSDVFSAVESFEVTYCGRQHKNECSYCKEPINIPVNAQEYIGTCMSTNVQLIAQLRQLCCAYGQKPTIEIKQRKTIREFFCYQHLQSRAIEELVDKRVYLISDYQPTPGLYTVAGWVKAHPKTQQITLLINEIEAKDDTYQNFELTKDTKKQLLDLKKIGIDSLLNELSHNVTGIYERNDMLLAYLLTFCSPRWLQFNNRRIRGWMTMAVVGDAGSGKTQTYQQLANWLDIGDIMSGLTASRTGIAYALVEHKQKGWQLKIGRYPMNTRKLLAIDEAQFIPQEDVRVIAKAMEEGFLQIDRVKSHAFETQTRLILISNPAHRAAMDNFAFGIQALMGLYDAPIIRRLDLAICANKHDIAVDINKRFYPGAMTVSVEALRMLIFWAWNMEPEQVIFTDDATDICLANTMIMAEKFGYHSQLQLVTKEDMRNKLARLSAAYAVLTVSVNKDWNIVVTAEHVDYITTFIDGIYSRDNCLLNQVSDIARQENMIDDYEKIKNAFLQRKIEARYSPTERDIFMSIIRIMRNKYSVRRDYLAEQCGCALSSIAVYISMLKKYSLIDTTKDGYRKTGKFNRFVSKFLLEFPTFLDDYEE